MKQNKIPRNEYIRKPVGKTNPYKHDVLYTNLGQWKYPGQVTRIPSNDITMQGVPYPVYGEDDLGYGQMMYPGMDYTFPGQYVTETPIVAYGGDPSLPNITDHYPFGGQNTKTHTHMKEGGWLDQYQKKGEVTSPIVYTDYNEYLKAKKSYDDSLNVRKKSDQTFKPGSKTRPLTKEEKEYWKDEKTGLLPYLVEYNPAHPGAGYFGHFKKPVVKPEYKKIEEPVKKEEPKKQVVAKTPKDYDYRQQEFSGNWKIMRYFDKIGNELYRDIDYGGGKIERIKVKEEGGEIGEDEFRRGGPYTPPKLKRKARQHGTSKNIQSSINKLFTRNYDVFGPGGKNIYNPKAYKTGGWLDNVD